MTDDAAPRPADQIEPDTKDWTWVLERPCPECGLATGVIATDQVPALSRAYGLRWVEVLRRPDAAARPSPGVWSPLEYACHVHDGYRVFRGRAELMLAEDDPTFSNWDQDAAAIEARYGEQAAATVAAELTAAAEAIAATFALVSGEQWARPGRRSNGASFTVETLAQYFLHDVAHHLHDVRG